MTGTKLWGIGIAILNVMYSFAYLGTSCSDLYTADENDVLPWVWIVIYTCNAALNTYLFLRMLKSDLIAILLWLSFTCMLFLFRLFGVDYDQLSSTYRIVTIVVNVYIFISIIIMAIVYKNLAKPKEEPVNNSPSRPWGAINRTGKTVSSPVDRTVAYNTNESISFITQPDFYAEPASSARAVGHIASSALYHHDNSDWNCCDNTGEESAEGGCDGGGDAGGCGGGDDGGGCDSGGGGGSDD
ncbi:hypothetical protein ACLKA6_015707 [Drosophila palustris]